MANDGAALTPRAVAQRLGLAASTLRIYSVKLSAVLSASAGRPSARSDGRPGVRVYAERDVALLGRAKELLGQGLTYDEAAAKLAGRPEQGAEAERRPRARASSGELGALVAALNGALERAMAATEAWQRLAEERGREVEALRARVERLEATAEEARERGKSRVWWRRIFAQGDES